MTHVPHRLTDEFPESTERLRALHGADAHFARLADLYETLNRQIHRIETNVEPASEQFETALRRKRLALKDEIYARLKAAAD
ncbi:MAG: YdcH family protein [Acidobacteria bacterium]|jgi:uncharacterized protein YdcH (DUF465 family)|nr:YdcH family protein [Acidobacteriota bacterium]